jgi:hypothetical protein
MGRRNRVLVKAPHIDGNDHSLVVFGLAEIRPVKGNGLSGVARHRDANEIAIADNAIGRVEFDPATNRAANPNTRAATIITVA